MPRGPCGSIAGSSVSRAHRSAEHESAAMFADGGTRLFITRDALDQSRLGPGPGPDAPAARVLADGEMRLAINRFALTANEHHLRRIRRGDEVMALLPVRDATSCFLPVWDYAVVIESRCESVEPGRRVWGYRPAGTHLVSKTTAVSTRVRFCCPARRPRRRSAHEHFAGALMFSSSIGGTHWRSAHRWRGQAVGAHRRAPGRRGAARGLCRTGRWPCRRK